MTTSTKPIPHHAIELIQALHRGEIPEDKPDGVDWLSFIGLLDDDLRAIEDALGFEQGLWGIVGPIQPADGAGYWTDRPRILTTVTFTLRVNGSTASTMACKKNDVAITSAATGTTITYATGISHITVPYGVLFQPEVDKFTPHVLTAGLGAADWACQARFL